MELRLVEFLLGLIFVWLGIVTFYIFNYIKNYRTLTKNISKKNLEFIFEKLSLDLDQAKKNISQLFSLCNKIETNNTNHIQKIGLIRFNPFKETGGDQSFILALRDAHNTGVVITGLYSKSGLRWYVKKIIEGKGVDHELSDEEKKALN